MVERVADALNSKVSLCLDLGQASVEIAVFDDKLRGFSFIVCLARILKRFRQLNDLLIAIENNISELIVVFSEILLASSEALI